MGIIIGADLVPTESNYDLFEKSELKTLFGEELLDIISKADFRIFNLETPITDIKTPIPKCGPALITPERVMPGLKALNVDLFTLANNHIMDQDEQGYYKTIELLESNNINYVGSGKNLSCAAKPYIFEFSGKKVGVYACAEHEFSIATENKCGANPFDPLESLDHIAELKKNTDFVIVLYHGGKEHYRYPSPNLQKVCRKIVEKGADLVVCQHSHCIGCEEKYNDATIVYGQGNFIFDASNVECWQTGLLIEITDDFKINYIPLIKGKNGVKFAMGEDKEKITKDFILRSNEIKKEGFISEKYLEFSKMYIAGYMHSISGKKHVFLFRVINKITGYKFLPWYIRKRYKKEKLAIKNYIECEAIREMLVCGIDEIIGGTK